MISEDGDTETEFAKAFQQLATNTDLGLWGKLMRADKISGIGTFGGIILGVRDGQDLSQPVDKRPLDGPEDLLYLRPFDQEEAEIRETVEDPQDKRYGLPLLYEIEMEDGKKEDVHWERVIHMAEGKLRGDVFGIPRLQRCFNRLDDLIKIVGGGSEAIWLGMRPGTLLGPKEGYKITMDNDEIEEEIENYAHDPLRFLMLKGIDAKQLGPVETVNMSSAFDVVFSLVALASGIPKRVLMGSASGELAAAKEDSRQWAGNIATRQKTYVEPEILRPFIDRLVLFGILPEATDGYHVGERTADGNSWRWPSIIDMTEEEKATIAANRATALVALSNAMANYIADPNERREILGLVPKEEFATNSSDGIVANALIMAAHALDQGDHQMTPEEFAEYAIATVRELERSKRELE
jgi:hypothetical protein